MVVAPYRGGVIVIVVELLLVLRSFVSCGGVIVAIVVTSVACLPGVALML